MPLIQPELSDDSPNFQLIENYWYWFRNWRRRTIPEDSVLVRGIPDRRTQFTIVTSATPCADS